MHIAINMENLRTTPALPTINSIIQSKLSDAAKSALKKNNASELSPIEKIALAVAAGVPFETKVIDGTQHIELCHRVGLTKISGVWHVGVTCRP